MPIAIAFSIWSWSTYEAYSTFAVRLKSAIGPIQLLAIGQGKFDHSIQKVKTVFMNESNTANSHLRTIDLFLNESDEKKLNSNLPHSGREYVEGRLLHSNGKSYKVKVKYRGDTLLHWAFYKKSLRIKTRKKRLFEGMRAFNLIVAKMPSQLNNYFPYKLANLWGFISPKVEMVNVRINGENRGIHLMVEQLEELTLRRNNRMPGDLYAGELVGKDSYRGINNHIFDFPKLWEKVAINNHYPPDSFKPLESLVQFFNSHQNDDIQNELRQMLNLEMWGRFAAFEIFIQSFHYDNVHNWRLYYDPAKSQFEPVIWDPVGWHPGWRPKVGESAQLDIMPSKFHEMLFQNYQILLARHQAIDAFFRSGLDNKFMAEVETVINNMKNAVESDPNIVVRFDLITPKEAKKAMLELRASMESVFNSVKDGYLGGKGSVFYTFNEDSDSLALTIDGRRPVQRLQLNFEQPLNSRVPVHIAYWVEGKRREEDISGAISMTGSSLQVNVPLLARHSLISKGSHSLKSNRLKIEPAYYELILKGMPQDNRLQAVYADRGGETPEQAQQVEYLDRIEFRNAFSIVIPQPLKVTEVWTGDINITGVRKMQGDLTIKPGASIKMAKDASLIIDGRLLAEGTSEQPIRFIPALKDQTPWGAVILKGRKANGSRLKHCEFSGGSGLKSDLFEYSAMLSIHDVKDVVISHCYFHDSKVVDDMVHAVYSDITFSDDLFERAKSDALDLDICKAVIERCRFTHSGNDAIDLMTTEAIVKDTFLQSNADKGISVGEGSKLFALNNQIIANNIGVQSKDGSMAVLYNVTLKKNRKALDAYKKNWRYGKGGTIHSYKSQISDNDSTFSADKKSLIRVYDSFLQGEVMESKRVIIDDTVDGRNKKTAKIKKLWRHRDDEAGPDFFNRYWSMVKPKQRGAVKVAY